MENASKALIIAGAILLSILIIGLGMAVYNSASSSTTGANLDAQEMQAHNAQFLSYEGKQKGAQVRTLVNAIRNNNMSFTDRIIGINFVETATGSTSFIKVKDDGKDPNDYNYNIKSTTTYFVTFDYTDGGMIDAVDIHVYSTKDLTGTDGRWYGWTKIIC